MGPLNFNEVTMCKGVLCYWSSQKARKFIKQIIRDVPAFPSCKFFCAYVTNMSGTDYVCCSWTFISPNTLAPEWNMAAWDKISGVLMMNHPTLATDKHYHTPWLAGKFLCSNLCFEFLFRQCNFITFLLARPQALCDRDVQPFQIAEKSLPLHSVCTFPLSLGKQIFMI